jgi:hypothetical protein
MEMDRGGSSCGFKNFESGKHVINTVMLKYRTEGQTKTGIVKIHLALNLEDNDLEYKGVECSDNDIRRYLENNPSVLSKINLINVN